MMRYAKLSIKPHRKRASIILSNAQMRMVDLITSLPSWSPCKRLAWSLRAFVVLFLLVVEKLVKILLYLGCLPARLLLWPRRLAILVLEAILCVTPVARSFHRILSLLHHSQLYRYHSVDAAVCFILPWPYLPSWSWQRLVVEVTCI